MSTLPQSDQQIPDLTLDQVAELVKDPDVITAIESLYEFGDPLCEVNIASYVVLRDRGLFAPVAPHVLEHFQAEELNQALRVLARGRGKGRAFMAFGAAVQTLAEAGVIRLREEVDEPKKPRLKVVGDKPYSAGIARTPHQEEGYLRAKIEESLPNSPMIEADVLAGLIQSSELREAIIDTIQPDHFFADELRALFQHIAIAHRKGPFDRHTLTAKSASKIPPALMPLAIELAGREVTGKDLALHAKILSDQSTQRATLRGLLGMLERVKKGEDPEKIVPTIFDLTNRIESVKTGPIDPGRKTWPKPPEAAAYKGVAGELVESILPFTESDPIAILMQFLVAFGSIIGRGAHWEVESTKHHTNLFAVLVGQSSRGRKGTSLNIVRKVFNDQDESWMDLSIQGGLTSGEGLISAVRDESRVGDSYDQGAPTKTALWVESEFGGTLAMASREGNSLSKFLRQAWDGDHKLKAASKNNPVESTDAHVSLIGHTTFYDLGINLSQNNLHNGLANRILWVCTRRSRDLPDGGELNKVNLQRFADPIKAAIKFGRAKARKSTPIPFDEPARLLWGPVYRGLVEERPGNFGKVVNRSEAQVRRLALIYALLDQSPKVKETHLRSAIALWEYCEQSAAYIFGDQLESEDSSKLYQAIRDAGKQGLTLTQVRQKVFSNRKPSDHYRKLLEELERSGLIVEIEDPQRPGAKAYIRASLKPR